MKNRITSLILSLIIITLALPLTANELNTVYAEPSIDGERIMYGGIAVDIGENTVVSENGALWLDYADGTRAHIIDIEAKYLNYYENRLWFVSGTGIMSCNPDGSELVTVKSFDSEIKCLYVTDNGFAYVRDGAVRRYENERESVLLEREGIEGFCFDSDGRIRWIVKNPDYVYTAEDGDEIYSDGNDEYFQYVSEINSSPEADMLYAGEDAGVDLQAENGEYSGIYVQVGDVTLPMAEHMPGTFFSKNGKACVCHNTAPTYCIQSEGNCNCMRYYPTGYKESCEIDLLGAQCFAFARMVFWKCFGFIDHSMNQTLYYSAGSLSSGAVTANSVKALMMKSAPGAHVRLAAGHSVSVLSVDEDFIVIYHGNAGGDGVISQPCIVSTRRYTWEQWATACAKGILYVNMPYNYPDSEIILSKKEIGFYKSKANLNLRAETNTESTPLCVVPNGTIISVTEVDGFWGKTTYNGYVGWVFLEYTTFYSGLYIKPSPNGLFVRGEDGYLRGVAWGLTFDSFSEHFDMQSISVASADGGELTASDYIGTGTRVMLMVGNEVVDTATVCLAGDVNGNGLLDVGDYLLAKRAYMGTYVPSDVEKTAIDVNGNGETDIYDYLFIRRYFFTENEELFSSFCRN
ncbi:MAG: SH3 domain-containing protein [Clostridia bacterium]|nr:SH3 domain-containing protein [Clostridia bacterium]